MKSAQCQKFSISIRYFILKKVHLSSIWVPFKFKSKILKLRTTNRNWIIHDCDTDTDGCTTKSVSRLCHKSTLIIIETFRHVVDYAIGPPNIHWFKSATTAAIHRNLMSQANVVCHIKASDAVDLKYRRVGNNLVHRNWMLVPIKCYNLRFICHR